MSAPPMIEEVCAALARGIAHAVSELTLEVHGRLVASTPVDTGWARANWVPSVGAPARGAAIGGARPSGKRQTRTAHAASNAAIAEGTARVIGYKVGEGSCYVSNNVPYISGPNSLDEGHSRQQPAGFIRRSIVDGTNAVAQRYESLEIKL